MHPLGSRKDRHACIGQGTIGYDALRRFVDLPELENIPLILETPSDLDGWANEIRMFRS
jgi:deoxyribonuclease-4